MGEIVVPDDESVVVSRDGIDTDEHNDLIAADYYEHEDNFETCIQANLLDSSQLDSSTKFIPSYPIPKV